MAEYLLYLARRDIGLRPGPWKNSLYLKLPKQAKTHPKPFYFLTFSLQVKVSTVYNVLWKVISDGWTDRLMDRLTNQYSYIK